MSRTGRGVPTRGRPAPPALPASQRGWLGLVGALAAPVVVLLGILHADEDRPGAVDVRVGALVDGARPPWWRPAALAVDFLGEPVGAAALVLVAVAGCLLLRRPRAAVLVVAAAGLTVGTTTLLKHVVGRTINGGYLSYPSGHTGFLTALALAVTLLAVGGAGRVGRTDGTNRTDRDGRTDGTDRADDAGPADADPAGRGRAARALLVATAVLVAGAVMGWAQVALGAHYPTDVLGGWCTALAVTPATAWLVDRTADAAGPVRRIRAGARSDPDPPHRP